MEDIQALQTLGSTHTTQLRGIANTQNLHERCISGLERDPSEIGALWIALNAISSVLLAELVPPPILPSRPRPRAHLWTALGSAMIPILSSLLYSIFSFPCSLSHLFDVERWRRK
ncbi:hypothetical protein Dimus_030353 [Dionaea muscipula]